MTTLTSVLAKEKSLAPVNLIATDLIKCTHCDMYIPHKQLQAHSQMHIPIIIKESSLRNVRNNHPQTKKKIDLKNILADEKFQEEIQVQSFLPDQLPCQEGVRKQALILPRGTQKYQSLDYEPSQDTKSSHQQTRCSFTKPEKLLQSTEFIPLSFSPETEQTYLEFKKQIKLSQQKKQLKPKSLNYYTNMKPNEDGVYQNKVVIPAKNNRPKYHDERDQNIQSYVIEPIQKIKKIGAPIRVQLNSTVKLVKQKQRISTASTGEGFYHQAQSHSSYRHNETNPCQTKVGTGVNQFECPECKGFYCKTCKSDIPPMFRPPIRKMQGQLLGIAKDWRQFRDLTASSCNKSNGQASRVTRCTNCE